MAWCSYQAFNGRTPSDNTSSNDTTTRLVLMAVDCVGYLMSSAYVTASHKGGRAPSLSQRTRSSFQDSAERAQRTLITLLFGHMTKLVPVGLDRT